MYCEYFPQTPKNRKRNKKYIVNFLSQLKKYPYDYFVKEKNNISIDKINTGMIDDYFVYQMNNTYINGRKKEPSLNTISKYAVALGMLFKFAYQRKYIQDEILVNKPSYKNEDKTPRLFLSLLRATFPQFIELAGAELLIIPTTYPWLSSTGAP